jgi:ribosomal protein S18 acetylase RimI-like enzyme
MSSIQIRRATLNDKAALRVLGIKTFKDTFDEHNTAEDMEQYIAKAFSDAQLEKELQENNTVFFLAEEGGRIVGYAKVREGEKQKALGEERALELHRIYVDKDFFGKKIGNILLETCLDYAKTSGYKTVWLGVWEHNAKAIAFYKKHGFEKFSAHVFVLGGDEQTDWLMKKDIV